ncbi:MAG: outer membrane protein assembly factor BamA [bacterium]
MISLLKKSFPLLGWESFAIGILILAVSASGQEVSSLKILGVSVEGQERVDEGLILATAGLIEGQTLSGDKVQSAIRALWALNLFSQVKVIAERTTSQGVFLLIQVQEFPRLEEVEVIGGKKLGKDEVKQAVDLVKGQILKPSDIVRVKRKISKLAADKGYLLCQVDITEQVGSHNHLRKLKLVIKEGPKVRIARIEFEGNEAFSDRTLRRQLKETKQQSFFRKGEFNRDKFSEDLRRIETFYRDRGFRDARVISDSIWYLPENRQINLIITIYEGRRYYFGDVIFSGAEIFTDEELRLSLLFKKGEIFSQKKFDASIQERLGGLYYDQGYIYAQIQPTLIPRNDTLDVQISIIPGNRFKVRQVHIVGNTKTYEKVIRREISLFPGEVFEVSRLRRSLRDINILNYFTKVEPDIEDVGEEEVDVYIKVEEKQTDQANLSAGYSERDGLVGSLGFSAPNFLGRGQQISLDWTFGSRYNSISGSFTEPWLWDTPTLGGLSGYNLKRRWVDGFDEHLLGGSVRVGRRLSWPDNYFRGDWVYRLERSKYTNFSPSFKARQSEGIVEDEVRISSSITQTITRDSRDQVEFPTTGSLLSLTSELAGGPLQGNDRYHKHIFSSEWFVPLSQSGRWVLAHSLLYGYLQPLDARPRNIPLLKYFFMGGGGLALGTPLRGYDDRTVGPLSKDGYYAQGGRAQFKVSAELRFRFVENPTIYTLAFFEAGNTWLTFRQSDLYDLKRSVGFGVRFFMPLVGMIGFDYGAGLDHRNPLTGAREVKWMTHFQFGRPY